jgi:hypothetical protein
MAYQDAWDPFLRLFKKFWPDCPHELLLITDRDRPGASWCSVVADFAARNKGAVMLLQEDFFLTAPVNNRLVDAAILEMQVRNAAMVRLYPCPGGDVDYGSRYFAEIPKGARYRVSCQASIWNSSVLYEIASHCNTAADFEIDGTAISERFDEPFLAFKREAKPWPIEYLCSGISRGKWNPDAKRLFEQHGISADYSLREMAS